jgi:hypothetical protein
MIVVDDILSGRRRAVLVAVLALVVLGVSLDHVVAILIVAPIAVAVQGMCSVRLPLWSPVRLAAICGGGALAAAWAVLLSYESAAFVTMPAIAWGAAIATAIASLTLARRLASTPVAAAFRSVAAAYETEPAVVAARLA